MRKSLVVIEIVGLDNLVSKNCNSTMIHEIEYPQSYYLFWIGQWNYPQGTNVMDNFQFQGSFWNFVNFRNQMV